MHVNIQQRNQLKPTMVELQSHISEIAEKPKNYHHMNEWHHNFMSDSHKVSDKSHQVSNNHLHQIAVTTCHSSPLISSDPKSGCR
jgi:hypothetical protein